MAPQALAAIRTAARPDLRPRVPARRLSPAAARATVLLAALAATAFGFLATDPQAAAHAVAADPELAWLLRAMAVLKMAMALAVTAAVVWRLADAVPSAWLGGYALALSATWAGPGLIWTLAHLRPGALLLHAGLAATLVLLWRDPAVGARLGAIIDARRRALREAHPEPSRQG